ncbi:MAG: DNA replication and repair protein RecF [Treponemataceae bacterium]|nr:MAG: DNA replication and repair protein RecF [Treponemataceae bacterium]
MPFLSVSFVNYRNLQTETLDISSKEVFFVGKNGQGKSNLLEALYYVSYGSSFRTHNDAEIIAAGQSEFSLRALYRDANAQSCAIAVYFSGGKKRIDKNLKRLSDRKELINTIPCVLYSHDDMDFVNGEPEKRRFFIDQTLSMYQAGYIDVMRQYKKALKNRNILLKTRTANAQTLDAYDILLIKYGEEIIQKRKTLIFSFNRIFTHLYEEVTGIQNVYIEYAPSFFDVQKRNFDIESAATSSGPHRDKIIFRKDNDVFTKIASTGQKRTLAILLRTAQAIFYKNTCQKNPVLLMDDVLLELDPEKRQKMILLLPEYEQLFCTFLPGEPYERYIHSYTKIYTIEDGKWTQN